LNTAKLQPFRGCYARKQKEVKNMVEEEEWEEEEEEEEEEEW